MTRLRGCADVGNTDRPGSSREMFREWGQGNLFSCCEIAAKPNFVRRAGAVLALRSCEALGIKFMMAAMPFQALRVREKLGVGGPQQFPARHFFQQICFFANLLKAALSNDDS